MRTDRLLQRFQRNGLAGIYGCDLNTVCIGLQCAAQQARIPEVIARGQGPLRRRNPRRKGVYAVRIFKIIDLSTGGVKMIERLHTMVDRAVSLPGIAQLRMRRFDEAFSKGAYGGACRGVFETYAQAVQAAPSSLPLGYDNPDAAALYRDRIERVFPSDYPAMLWLQKAFADQARHILDLGGHVGISYYAYQRYMAYPEGMTWQVCDVPAVVLAGQYLARERDEARRLKFTEQFDEARRADVLFSSGCLQYLQETLAQRLAALPSRPRWIVLNLIPLHESKSFWTVQSIAEAFCPYRIQRKDVFFAELDALGYEVLDVWENLEKACIVQFEPGYSLDRYAGVALRLRG